MSTTAHLTGYNYAFPRPATDLSTVEYGMDLYTWLFGQALTGAVSTGTTPVIAARIAHEAATEGLKHIAAHEHGVEHAAEAPDLLTALKAMVASYDGIRDGLTSPMVLAKLHAADAAIAKAEGR